MSSPSISKIHVTNSTGLSLNDRFTGLVTHREPKVVRSRSRSMPRKPPVDRAASAANRILLQQLSRREKNQAALKLKRRSIRTAGHIGTVMKRGTIKALRVAPNGRPIRANTMANVATMNADFITNAGGNRGRPLRRSNSSSNIAGRLGNRRPSVGGAAQRIAQRRMDRNRGAGNGSFRPQQNQNIDTLGRGRSRSRSRGRVAPANVPNARGRSMSRGRSLSRGRNAGGIAARRAPSVPRSRSRNRGRPVVAGARPLPIKARLGVRPGQSAAANAGRRNGRGGRNAASNIGRRGVAEGRVQKRRNTNAQQGGANGGRGTGGGVGGRVGRPGARSAVRNAAVRSRSQSRTRKGSVGQQQQTKSQQQQQRSGGMDRGRRRGRSQQRNVRGRGGATQRNGKTNGTNGKQQNQQQQQQPRRGRSRSRGGSRGARGGPGGQNLGKNAKPQANKDALDQELDTYMATTKNENDMDFLLKN